MSGAIRWEDPPPYQPRARKGDGEDHRAFAHELKGRPGDWAVLPWPVAQAVVTAAQIRSGSLAAYRPGGDFEAVSRTANGMTRVYARYVGESS